MVWTRLFVVVIGNTVFSVSAILSVFMAGLALGSRLAGRVIDRRPVPLVRTYASLEALIAIYNLALPILLRAANPLFAALYNSGFNSFAVLTFGRLVIALLLLIIPSTLMGATLPILIRFYTENILSVGQHAGRVYTANTLGAAAGTAVAGFVLVPYAGVTMTLFLAVATNLLISAIAWMLSRSEDAASQRKGSPLLECRRHRTTACGESQGVSQGPRPQAGEEENFEVVKRDARMLITSARP